MILFGILADVMFDLEQKMIADMKKQDQIREDGKHE